MTSSSQISSSHVKGDRSTPLHFSRIAEWICHPWCAKMHKFLLSNQLFISFSFYEGIMMVAIAKYHHPNFLENIEDIQWFDVDYGIYFTIETRFFISSPELKAQVSFSDQNLSVVRRCRRKLFTFSSSPEPLGQFQPNLAQNILGWRGFKFVQMKGPALFQGEIITK